jgi:proteic killer suppression protein
MEVKYADKKLEKLCTDEREMWKHRSDIASKLKLRVNALHNARNLGHLVELDPLGRWHKLAANLSGLWAGSVSPNKRILIRPDGDVPDVDAATITVIEIGEDYH